jgi:hypothetical protein
MALGSVLVIPALIHGWGVRGYGEWIALTALTSYMTYSNFGLVSTSMNEMIMASSAKDFARAAHVFQMSINLTLYIILPIIFLIASAIINTPVIDMMKLGTISKLDASWITILVASQFFFLTLRGILIAVLYTGGSYGFVYYVISGTKLTELIVIAVGASMFGFRPVQAAAVSASISIFEVCIIALLARRAADWMTLNLKVFDRSWIGRQAPPTLGFLLGNLATQGILLQGARIVLNVTLGGGAVAVYAIYGTAMRLVDQVLQMIAQPLEVEMAHSLGRNDPRRTRRLVAVGTQISWLIFSGVGLSLLLLGPVAFHWWTAGRIGFSRGFMALYLCMSMASLVGRISNHALISTNRMYGPSFLMVACSLAAVALGGALTVPFKLTGMVLGGILGETANSLVALLFAARLLGCSVGSLFADMVDFRRSFDDLWRHASAVFARYRRA